MSLDGVSLANEFVLLKGIHFWNPNFAAEMGAVVTALGSDTTTMPATTQTPPAALQILQRSSSNTATTHTGLTNDIVLLVNAARAARMTNSQIIGALDDALGTAHAPSNTNVPYASANASPAVVGTVVTVTTGTWVATPTGYTYQWKRDGVTNLGTAASYTLVSADIGGHAITCVVTATNATGSTAAPPSNPILT